MIYPNAKALTLTAPLALAALRGPKTRTMRPMNYQMPWVHHVEPLDPAKWGKEFPGALPGNSTWLFQLEAGPLVNTWFNVFASPWKPGDVLWLREPGRVVDVFPEISGWSVDIKYLADEDTIHMPLPARFVSGAAEKLSSWVWPGHGIPNGIFREAARSFFEVTAAWPMRVQDISEAGAWAEGIEELDGMFDAATICAMAKRIGCPAEDARPTFACAWDSIYAKRPGYVWDANPLCWAYTFKRLENAA